MPVTTGANSISAICCTACCITNPQQQHALWGFTIELYILRTWWDIIGFYRQRDTPSRQHGIDWNNALELETGLRMQRPRRVGPLQSSQMHGHQLDELRRNKQESTVRDSVSWCSKYTGLMNWRPGQWRRRLIYGTPKSITSPDRSPVPSSTINASRT